MTCWQLDWRIDQTAVIKDGPGTFEVNVVGSRSHQQVLSEIVGQEARRGAVVREAILELDDDNPHDRYAVACLIDDRKVGVLSWPHAVRFRDVVGGHRRLRSARCSAVILSPGQSGEVNEHLYRVRLDLPRPAAQDGDIDDEADEAVDEYDDDFSDTDAD